VYFKDCTWPSDSAKTLLKVRVIHFRYNQERGNLNKQHYYNSSEEDCTYPSAHMISHFSTTSARQTSKKIEGDY
jgi:hypothetical protein